MSIKIEVTAQQATRSSNKDKTYVIRCLIIWCFSSLYSQGYVTCHPVTKVFRGIGKKKRKDEKTQMFVMIRIIEQGIRLLGRSFLNTVMSPNKSSTT
jgi:hypothetical protein